METVGSFQCAGKFLGHVSLSPTPIDLIEYQRPMDEAAGYSRQSEINRQLQAKWLRPDKHFNIQVE
jgi:hypothetical protein